MIVKTSIKFPRDRSIIISWHATYGKRTVFMKLMITWLHQVHAKFPKIEIVWNKSHNILFRNQTICLQGGVAFNLSIVFPMTSRVMARKFNRNRCHILDVIQLVLYEATGFMMLGEIPFSNQNFVNFFQNCMVICYRASQIISAGIQETQENFKSVG